MKTIPLESIICGALIATRMLVRLLKTVAVTEFLVIWARPRGLIQTRRRLGHINSCLVALSLMVTLVWGCGESSKSRYEIEDAGRLAAQRYIVKFGNFLQREEVIENFKVPSSDVFCFGFRGIKANAGTDIYLAISVSQDENLIFEKKAMSSEWTQSSDVLGNYFYYGRDNPSTCASLNKGERYIIRAKLINSSEIYKKLELIALGGGWK